MAEIKCGMKNCVHRAPNGTCGKRCTVELDEDGYCQSMHPIHTCVECVRFGKQDCTPGYDVFLFIAEGDGACNRFEAKDG